MLIAEAPESCSLGGDKTSFMIYCESIKERGIRHKTEKILKKNFEKKTTLKKKTDIKETNVTLWARDHCTIDASWKLIILKHF